MIVFVAGEGSSDARWALLARLIDHAPTFPPARLPTAEALAEDRRARASAEAWLLGRLVWRSSRLAELAGYDRVPLSLVLDGPVPTAGREASRVEAMEARWPEQPAFGGEVFVELPLDDRLEQRVERVRASGALAKVRCGGERTPTSAELARFIGACSHAGLPFKASAGLHHAVRSGTAHGFLNLLAAALFPERAEEALDEEGPAAFAVDANRFAWSGLEADAPAIARMRRERFRSCGSCSFAEPVDELRALAIL
jgi:hypothetical protein